MQLVMEARAGLCRLHRDGARRVDLECAIVMKEAWKVDLGLYGIISTGISVACWLKPGIDFDIDW